MRLFLGIELPKAVRESLQTICCGLKDVRWVAPDNFHLTLSFLGDLTPGEAEDLDAMLMKVRHEGFELGLSDVGIFEHKGHVRVLWAGVCGELDRLGGLHRKILQAVDGAGLQVEHRKFKPHVTLSYARALTTAQVAPYLTAHALFKSPFFPVEKVTLFRSHLGKGGAFYEPLRVYPLSGGSDVDFD